MSVSKASMRNKLRFFGKATVRFRARFCLAAMARLKGRSSDTQLEMKLPGERSDARIESVSALFLVRTVPNRGLTWVNSQPRTGRAIPPALPVSASDGDDTRAPVSEQSVIIRRETNFRTHPPDTSGQNIVDADEAVARLQTELLFCAAQGAFRLDIAKKRLNDSAFVIEQNRFISVMFVTHICESAGMVARLVHVTVKLLLQVPVVADVPNDQTPAASC